MQKPNEWNPVEIEFWREYHEMKRLRRDIIGMEDFGWDGEELRGNENGK